MNRQSDRLPQGWKWVRLGDVCQIIRGVVFKKAQAKSIPAARHLPVLRAGNIADKLRTDDDLVWIPEELVAPAQKLKLGDIAMCISSGSASVVGKTAMLRSDWNGTIGGFCAIIRAESEQTGQFLGYWFRSHQFLAWRDSQARGSNIQNLRTRELSKYKVPLPPLSEQKRIADLLNQQMAYVEKARKAAEEMLEAAQALPGAFLRQAFPYNLSRDQVGTSNTDNRYFPMVPLGEVAELIRGITFRKSDQLEQATEDSLPIATTKAAQESGIIEDALYHIPRSLLKDERKLLRPGDILISTANSLRLVGRTTHVQDINRPISFGAFMTVIRSNAKILDTYLIHCLRTEFAYDFFSRNATTTTNISNLNFRKLAALRIPLPPLTEQQRIAALLNQQMAYVETVRMSAREQLDAINALPAALLRRAFAGTL